MRINNFTTLFSYISTTNWAKNVKFGLMLVLEEWSCCNQNKKLKSFIVYTNYFADSSCLAKLYILDFYQPLVPYHVLCQPHLYIHLHFEHGNMFAFCMLLCH